MRPEEVIVEARTWLGVPFRHQGRSRTGVDCIGLVIAVLAGKNMLPKNFEGPSRYGREPGPELIAQLERYCVKLVTPMMGSIVAIRWPGKSYASHVALCAGETIIHCFGTSYGVVEVGYRGRWVKATESVWAVKGVVYE